MFAELTGSPIPATCQVGLVSVGATCDVLMLHLLRKRLRARSLPSATMHQKVRPDFVETTSRADGIRSWAAKKLPPQVVQRLIQLPPRTLVTVFVAFVALGCAPFGMRLRGASRRRKRKIDNNKTLVEEKFVPLTYTDQDEPDAEPKNRTWWTSNAGNAFRRTTSDTDSVRNGRQCCRPVVPAKSLMPEQSVVPVKALVRKRPVASTDDEPEDEDSAGSDRGAAPGTRGFVAQQAAEVERVVTILNKKKEGQIHLVDQEGVEQLNRQTQVVPDGLVRSYTVEFERQTSTKPPAPTKGLASLA